jgi:hypothetical protein
VRYNLQNKADLFQRGIQMKTGVYSVKDCFQQQQPFLVIKAKTKNQWEAIP